MSRTQQANVSPSCKPLFQSFPRFPSVFLAPPTELFPLTPSPQLPVVWSARQSMPGRRRLVLWLHRHFEQLYNRRTDLDNNRLQAAWLPGQLLSFSSSPENVLLALYQGGCWPP